MLTLIILIDKSHHRSSHLRRVELLIEKQQDIYKLSRFVDALQ